MAFSSPCFRFFRFAVPRPQAAAFIFCGAMALTLAALSQQDPATQQPSSPPSTTAQPTQQSPAPQNTPPAPAPEPAATVAPQSTASPSTAPPDAQVPQPPVTPSEAPTIPARSAVAPHSASTPSVQPAEITEDQIRNLLVGKQLFLRGGYLDNTLSFNEHGSLIGHSPQGSYTLNAMQIDKVHLTRHKVELVGQRFGLHFLGALPYEDPTKAVDRVNITPKKKEVKITIDRELVVKPKQPKNKSAKNTSKPPQKPAPNAAAPASATATPAENPPARSIAPTAQPAPASEPSDAAQAQAEMAAAPPAERPADPNSVTTTTSVAHANKLLQDAIDNVFAQGFDARLMDAMPGFWKLYYQAAAAKTDYRPTDPSVLRQNMVDQKAKLISSFDPTSNQYAQDSGVAGMSLYHVVVGADGKPEEISVARPIGFGLDESAVDSIRKATFSPATKDGKPVPVLLDLVVEFRIYSKRTNVASTPAAANQSSAPALPGPYSNQHQ